MALGASALGRIAAETNRVAPAACPKGQRDLPRRAALGLLVAAAAGKPAYSRLGQAGLRAWRVLGVPVLPLGEGWSDRPAAAAGRGRIDWTEG
jgi:transposase